MSDRPAPTPRPIERLTYRIAETAATLGMSRRSFERLRAAGRFPKPDLHIGKCPLWKPETVQRWIDQGGQP